MPSIRQPSRPLWRTFCRSKEHGLGPHEASARERGEGVLFERVRRITGYLVGTLDRFNNAKRAEERDRVKHGMGEYQVPRGG